MFRWDEQRLEGDVWGDWHTGSNINQDSEEMGEGDCVASDLLTLPTFNDLVEKVPNKVEQEMNQGKINVRNNLGKTAQQGLSWQG